jgi:serine/threonine protein kinase
LKVFENEIKDMLEARDIFNDALVLINLLDKCSDPVVKSGFVQVYDIGAAAIEEKEKNSSKKGYITMEYMDSDLRAIIGNTGSPDFRKRTVTEVLKLMNPVIEALAYMHGQDRPVLHRDIKPENVLISGGKHIKVADFGLAVEMFDLLKLPEAAGTIPYQDLESFSKRNASTQSDVYAIGVMFYEFLTGKYPYDIKSLKLDPNDSLSYEIFAHRLERVMSEGVVPPSNFNSELKKDNWLEEIIIHCLKPYRPDRIKNAVELRDCINKQQPPGPRLTKGEKYKVYLEKGQKARLKGKEHYPEAGENFGKACELLPQYCDAAVAVANLLVEKGESDEAARLLNQRLRDNRRCPHVLRELANLYKKKGNSVLEDYYNEEAGKMPACNYSIRDFKV